METTVEEEELVSPGGRPTPSVLREFRESLKIGHGLMDAASGEKS